MVVCARPPQKSSVCCCQEVAHEGDRKGPHHRVWTLLISPGVLGSSRGRQQGSPPPHSTAPALTMMAIPMLLPGGSSRGRPQGSPPPHSTAPALTMMAIPMSGWSDFCEALGMHTQILPGDLASFRVF